MRRDGAYAAPGKSAVTASSSTRVRARSTLGMMLDGSTISNLCVGGPAFNCQRLEKHDVIVGAHPPGNRVHSERSDLLCALAKAITLVGLMKTAFLFRPLQV